jgi:adenylate cyclase
MIMALFNAPLDDDLHADHAVQCAIAMQRRLAELNQDWKARGLPELASGVGINTGEVIAGNVGSESIQSYTVIGDNVNLGARLESLCKQYKSSIIISSYTKELLQGAYDIVELDEVIVKGKSQSVKIFRVTS